MGVHIIFLVCGLIIGTCVGIGIIALVSMNKLGENNIYEKNQSRSLICCSCGNEMFWQSDFNFEEYGYDGEGLVSNYSCSNPNCKTEAEYRIGEMEEDDCY